jgi:hypothetical protein
LQLRFIMAAKESKSPDGRVIKIEIGNRAKFVKIGRISGAEGLAKGVNAKNPREHEGHNSSRRP